MLNKGERFKVLKFFRVCSIVGQLPVEVDLTNWQIRAPPIKKRCVSAILYSFLLLHTLYKAGTLVHAYFCVPDAQLHQLLIHAVVAAATTLYSYWYYVAYIQDPALFAAYFKMTLLGNIGPDDFHSCPIRVQCYVENSM